VRYERHPDHPDEIVIRRRRLFRERLVTVPFEQVANVDPERECVYLAIPSASVKLLPELR
jgi:hypothetical protein